MASRPNSKEKKEPTQDRMVAEPRLSHEEIGRRAHGIYLDRGGIHGYDLGDWLRTDRELKETNVLRQGTN